MNINKLPIILFGVCFANISELKANEISTESSLTVVNQYVFRGFQTSQNNPAIQADYIIKLENGLWFGAWGSNYDFGSDEGVEIDLMAGYDFSLNKEFLLGFGLTEYTYTGDSDSSSEYFISLSYSQYSLTYYDDVDLNNNYLSIDAEFTLNDVLSLQLHAANNDSDAGVDHTDFSIGVSFSYSDKVDFFATAFKNNSSANEAGNNIVIGATYSL